MTAKKCSVKKWCLAMDEFADSQYGRGRRIFVTQTMNFQTGREGHAAAYEYGPKRAFVWLNFCPWCGSKVQFPDSRKKAKKPTPGKASE
jgi:hypothetical protein